MKPPSEIPRYRALMEALRALIVDEGLGPGDKLPTVVALMARYGVGRNPVQRAVAALVEEGVLESRQGAGIFVAPAAPRPAAAGSPWSLPFPAVRQRPVLTFDTLNHEPEQHAAWQRIGALCARTTGIAFELVLQNAPPPTFFSAPGQNAAGEPAGDLVQIHSTLLPLCRDRGDLLPLGSHAPGLKKELGGYGQAVTAELTAGDTTWGAPGLASCNTLFVKADRLAGTGLTLAGLRRLGLAGLLRRLAAVAPGPANSADAPFLHLSSSFAQYLVSAGMVTTPSFEALTALPLDRLGDFLETHAGVLQNPVLCRGAPWYGLEATGFADSPVVLHESTSFSRLGLRRHRTLDWAMLPFPAAPRAWQPVAFDALCASAACQHPELAAAFIQCAASRAGQMELAATGRFVLHPQARRAAWRTFLPCEHAPLLEKRLQRAAAFAIHRPETNQRYTQLTELFMQWQRRAITTAACLKALTDLQED